MSDTPLIDVARQWVTTYPYNSGHLTQSLVWLDRLAPGRREAVRLATLTHDMERAFPGPDQPLPARLNDDAYYHAHSERSARIVSAWLREQGAPGEHDTLARDVEALVLVHEFGGWPEANLVQAADSLSFLETNIDLFLDFARSDRYPVEDIAIKFHWMLDRIQIDDARTFGEPMLAQALTRLAQLNAQMAGGGERVGGSGGAEPPGVARASEAREPRERSGESGAPARERVGGSGGAEPPGVQ